MMSNEIKAVRVFTTAKKDPRTQYGFIAEFYNTFERNEHQFSLNSSMK
jgi:hypothetical protein